MEKALSFHPTLVLAQRIMAFLLPSFEACFHPTLVLAQLVVGETPYGILAMFPSHIGSRSTLHIRQYMLHNINVSIPHWFSLNEDVDVSRNLPDGRFHPTLVLAQRNMPNGDSLLTLCFHPTLVLAQPGVASRWHHLSLFPSHIGSRSTWQGRLTMAATYTCFHPTLVLAQHDDEAQGSSCKPFPSHIGSRSTGGLMNLKKGGEISFHPTLVLAQQDVGVSGRIRLDTFPSHIGSRSTGFR